MVSRLATKAQSTGPARSGPRTNRSHVDVVEYALSARQEKRALHSAGSSGLLAECNCTPYEDSGAAAAAVDGGAGVCFDCGRAAPQRIAGAHREGAPRLTWVEMIKT